MAGAYTVRPGDTLFGLARAHGTTVAELLRLNDLTGTTLEVGQTLRLPGRAPVVHQSLRLPEPRLRA
ncbi:LysM peptidoglycan-binding domain-containing protein [Deinococcus malanensis]|uniref:LysM peptidoglycan-binding domain-containing protein n=1 Tax=Deinococcus malanensis TaxID=1706855 RepID=UPI00362F24D5